jgi:secreted trypsin-like serine protease
MVRIQYLLSVGGGGGQGGGAVISHRHILTSAFVLNPGFTVLRIWAAGITRLSQRELNYQRRLRHPQYTITPRRNDIGIIFLNADLPFDRFTQPIVLPESEAPYLNEQMTVLGFGGFPTSPNREHLEAAFVRVVATTRCETQFAGHVVAQQFCGEDTRLRSDFCSDDLGGPAVITVRGTPVLAAIASIDRCLANNVPSQPSLYTRVYPYRNWIRENTGI